MVTTFTLFFLSSLVSLFGKGSQALEVEVKINVPNTPAAARFTHDVGADYVKQTIVSATNFTLNLFNEKTAADTRGYSKVTFILDKIPDGIGVTVGNTTTISAQWVEKYVGDLKTDITGVMYHENTHIWQWLGENVNTGIVEGIADFVRLKAGLAPKPWLNPGEGNKWDEGYAVTCRFLEYLESLMPGFVAAINKKMKGPYSDTFFVELLGKPVDQLWKEYKAKYNHTN